MSKKIKHIIVGAGIAGLNLAVQAKDEAEDFLLIEKSSKLGGTWQSHKYKNTVYEFGPNTILDKSDRLRELIKKARLEDQLLTSPLKDSKRYFYRQHKFIEVPMNPFGFIGSKLMSMSGKLRMLKEPFTQTKSNENESVFDFFARRLGTEFSENLLSPAMQGIWGGDIKSLNVSAAMPFLYELEKNSGSLIRGMLKHKSTEKNNKQIISFKNGLETLCLELGNYIGSENIALNYELKKIEAKDDLMELSFNNGEKILCEKLSLACPSTAAANALSNYDTELANALKNIYYAPMYLFAFSLKKTLFKDLKQLDAFGYLNTNQTHFTLGSIFASELFPERKLKDEILFVNFLGGSKHPQILDFSQSDLQATAYSETKEIFDNAFGLSLRKEDFNFIADKLCTQAIPQYNENYIGAKKIIEQFQAKNTNIRLYGNYLGGISIPDTIKNSTIKDALQLKA